MLLLAIDFQKGGANHLVEGNSSLVSFVSGISPKDKHWALRLYSLAAMAFRKPSNEESK